jgi:hypothetical protein
VSPATVVKTSMYSKIAVASSTRVFQRRVWSLRRSEAPIGLDFARCCERSTRLGRGRGRLEAEPGRPLETAGRKRREHSRPRRTRPRTRRGRFDCGGCGAGYPWRVATHARDDRTSADYFEARPPTWHRNLSAEARGQLSLDPEGRRPQLLLRAGSPTDLLCLLGTIMGFWPRQIQDRITATAARKKTGKIDRRRSRAISVALNSFALFGIISLKREERRGERTR